LKTLESNKNKSISVHDRLYTQKEKEGHSKSNTKIKKTVSNRQDSKDRDSSQLGQENTKENMRKRSITPKRTNSAIVKPRKTSERSFNLDSNFNGRLERKQSLTTTQDRDYQDINKNNS